MGTRDPRIDAYIDRHADFAKPILTHLRAVVHAACPDVEETVKWGAPFFLYKGILCSMAAFKEHCAFGFWHASHVMGANESAADKAAGQFGRITSVADLPSKAVLTGYVKAAMKANESGVKSPTRSKPRDEKRAPLPIPDELTKALRKNKKAHANFEAFSPSKQRDYAEWISSAKSDATRARRLETAVEWIAEGKSRNWKYERR